MPGWLPYDAESWAQHKTKWFEQMDGVFRIDVYLREYFRTTERLREAEQNLVDALTEVM